MQVMGLDENFKPIQVLRYTNLQWNRSYYSPGQFVLQMPAKYYDPAIAYVFTAERPETGIVQKVHYVLENGGATIELSGFFLEKILGDKIIGKVSGSAVTETTFYANGNIETEIRRMLTQYKADIPRLVLGEVAGLGEDSTWQDTGGELDVVAAERLQAQQLGYRCFFDYEGTENIVFTVWQGKDRTQSQSENSFVVFSDTYGNISKAEITFDDSNHKTFGIIGGSGEGVNRIFELIDLSAGGYKKMVFIDSSEQYDQDKQSQAVYRAALRQSGMDEILEKYGKIENATITASSVAVGGLNRPQRVGERRSLRYLEDFDLGDRCDVLINRIGFSMEARIISVKEVVKQNTHTAEIELGDAILTNVQKSNLR